MFHILYLVVTAFRVLAEAPTPVMFTDLPKDLDLAQARPWVAPDYSQQKDYLGYSEGAFAIPKGMEEQVSFWLDIYTKYTTDQGLLHDSRYVHLVYEEVDFSDIMANSLLTQAQKRKEREKRVKEGKKRVRERLVRLQALKDGEGLEGEDLRYWQLFNRVDEKKKFIEASRKGRLRFQLGQKDRFVRGIFYSGRYLDDMEKIFRDYQLPLELTRLPFVESSFNFKARSKVGASGIWQFMRSSARRVLHIDAVVDERNDPLLATEAAAKMLRNNYNMLGSWPLAVTAYNHGAYGMKRLIKKYNTDNIVELLDIRKGRFGFASANFYASYLAALEAEKNATKYYGPVYREKLLEHKILTLSKPVSRATLLKWFDNDEEKAKDYNPHLSSYFWKGYRLLQKLHKISLPVEKYDIAVAELKELPIPKAEAGEGVYSIVRGDTLSQIAENFGISLNILKEANGIDDPRKIRAGQKLVIPK